MKGALPELKSEWPSTDFKPCVRLLIALLEDVYHVRDLVVRCEAHGRKLPPGIRGKSARDRHWIGESEDDRPFTLGWVCQHLGLEAQAVQGSYLSGAQLALGEAGGCPSPAARCLSQGHPLQN
jgi:hypothetical protein